MKQIDVAIAVVFDRSTGQLLICKRKPDAVLAGYWEFPGGKCDPGEPPAACAVREVEEETALIVRVLKPLAPLAHQYPHAHVRLCPFVCEKTAGTLELRAVAEALWIAPATLHNYRFPEANAPLLNEVARGLASLLSADVDTAPQSPH